MNAILANFLITLGFYILMEFVAWFTHKYIMHGFLWKLHSDHHKKDHDGFWERNDFFFLLFAIPGIIFLYLGMKNNFSPLFYAGLGITLYGFSYFLVHDVFIHQRIPLLKRTNNIYFRAIRKAHKVHHKHLGKEKGECFGMLWVPLNYFREATKTKSLFEK